MDKVIVFIGRQNDGLVFRLESKSKEKIKEKSDYQHLPRSLFISFDVKEDFEKIHGSMYEHVLTALTGLSREALNSLGGYEIIEPVNNKILYSSIYEVKEK